MNQSDEYIVLKFGGTSQIKSTYDMILNRIQYDTKIKFIIVLSAMSGTTNKLIKYSETRKYEILEDIIKTNEELAYKCGIDITDTLTNLENMTDLLTNLNNEISFVAQGEFLTCNILNKYLKSNGINSEFISSLDVIESSMENTSLYNKGEFKVKSNLILKSFETNNVVIIPGFSGGTPTQKMCLLGRGGSDTTGSILAAEFNAIRYEIWTDVNGIFSSDPRKINNTIINIDINYEAAQEVAAMGAKVIHPYCILPCANKNIPIYIRNTFKPYEPSTIIHNTNGNNIYAITQQDNIAVFKITSMNMWNNYGFVYDIFSIFAEFNIDINIINTSQFNITTTTHDVNVEILSNIKERLKEKYEVELSFNNTIVSIVADNVRLIDKIGDVFKLTKQYNIITTSYSSNDLTLSFVIDTNDALNLAQDIHNLVFL